MPNTVLEKDGSVHEVPVPLHDASMQHGRCHKEGPILSVAGISVQSGLMRILRILCWILLLHDHDGDLRVLNREPSTSAVSDISVADSGSGQTTSGFSCFDQL